MNPTLENTLVLIPARGGSKGVPHKNKKPFANGKSLVERTIETALSVFPPSQIVLSTDDLEILKKVLSTESVNHPQPPLSFRISGLSVDTPFVIKVKKMACRSLKGKGANTGLRVIYAYHPQEQHIQLIEIYFKADQENEDRARILKHFS